MTDPNAIEIPWDALERFAQAIGAPHGVLLEMSPPLSFDDPQPWRLGGPALDRGRERALLPLAAFHRHDERTLLSHRDAAVALADALPPPPTRAAFRVQALLAPGHAVLRTEDRDGVRVRLVRPRPGRLRLPGRHSVHHLRPDARKVFAAWAAHAPDGLALETGVGPAHARLAAEAAIPAALRDLPSLWPEETRPRLGVRTWPGIAACLLVFDHGGRRRQDHLLFLARRTDR